MVHVPLMFLSEWREFPFGALPCRTKNWWHLASRCCWNRAHRLKCFLSASVTRKDLQFGTWTGVSFQRHYRFRPSTSRNKSGSYCIFPLRTRTHHIPCWFTFWASLQISHTASNKRKVYLLFRHPFSMTVLLPYTGCPRRNVQYFGRVFLMLNYTDITLNTYIQSWTVTEIMAREKCGHLAFPRTVRLQL